MTVTRPVLSPYAPAPSRLPAPALPAPAAPPEVPSLDRFFMASGAAGVTYRTAFAAAAPSALDGWGDPLVVEALKKHEKQPS
jgi:hypothetical protein